jgi:hypothetical protein
MMRALLAPALLAATLFFPAAASAQNAGCSTGPFLKVADLWLVYTRPGLFLEGGRVWAPARYLAAVAGMGFAADPMGSCIRLSFAGHTLEFGRGRGYRVDGQPGVFEVSPVVREGRVVVPVREVARALRLSLRWDGAYKAAFLEGEGLARELHGRNPSARFYLVDNHRGALPAVPEIPGLVPTAFCWHWKRGFYASPQVNAKTVDLARESGFRLLWKRTRRLPEQSFVLLGLGADDPTSPLGYFVQGYGQYGFPYVNEGLGGRDPNDREYCRPKGRSGVLCEVGPVLYSEPEPYPREPRVIIGAPRFVFARVYSF